MSGFLTSVFSFLVAIAILVAVHEWGHYIVARMVGVKVLRFSIGFGRPFWTTRYGQDQTEFCLSSIPIGGYVKLLDERDCAVTLEDQERALNRQSILARIAILFAGPGMNFLFAIFAYWCVFVTGVPGIKPVVGNVDPQSVADQAGLVTGDQLVRIGERTVSTWDSAILAILDSLLADGDIPLQVAGEDGQERLVILRTAGQESNLTEPGQLFIGLGFRPWSPDLPPVVDEITPEGPADRAGLRTGDEVIEADGVAITSWLEWVEFVRARPSERVEALISRDDSQIKLFIDIGDIQSDGERIGRIGASVKIPEDLYADMRAERRYGVIEAWPAAVSKTWEMMALTVRMVASMVSGDVSVKNISGPINIAQYAGYSASIGLLFNS